MDQWDDQIQYFGFANKYFNGEPIRIFNNGDFENDLYRDFTYIDDIVVKMHIIPAKNSTFCSN